jgi:hypothetical protein
MFNYKKSGENRAIFSIPGGIFWRRAKMVDKNADILYPLGWRWVY